MSSRIPDRPPLENPISPPATQAQAPNKWANSPTALKIKSFIYKTISLAVKPFNSTLSDYYHFRMKRVDTKLINVQNHKHLDMMFHGHRLPGGINFVQKSAAENPSNLVEGKLKLSEELLAEIQKNHRFATASAPSKELITEGICFGIMADIADHHLNHHAEIEPILQSLQKGGSANAEIYQGAINSVTATVSRSFIIDNVHNTIDEMKNDPEKSTLSSLLPVLKKEHLTSLRSIIFNLEVIDSKPPAFMESIRQNPHYASHLFPANEELEAALMNQSGKSQDEIQNIGLIYLMAKSFEAIKEENRSQRTDLYNGKDILDFGYAQKKVLQELDAAFNEKMQASAPEDRAFLIKRREQLIGEVKLAAATAEYDAKGTITTDALLNAVFDNQSLLIRQEALLSLRGLKMDPCAEKMGYHMQFKDDAQYINNLDKLDPGFYLLSIKTKFGGHAVSLVKEDDGSGYLIDPNNRTLKFSNDKEAKELVNALTSTYSQPETLVPGHPYHKLAFFKIEQKA